MKSQELRDKVGRLIGRIQAEPSGRLVLRDAVGRPLGTFDPRDNVTRDSKGNRVGTGNLLSMMLRR